jgi:hypothetical protein
MKENIFLINREQNRRRGFQTQEEAEEFLESVEDPNLWDSEFDKGYEKTYLDNFEKVKKDNELINPDIEVLRLISLENYNSTIKKVMKIEIDDSIKRLIYHKLIEGNYDKCKITKKGIEYLEKWLKKQA